MGTAIAMYGYHLATEDVEDKSGKRYPKITGNGPSNFQIKKTIIRWMVVNRYFQTFTVIYQARNFTKPFIISYVKNNCKISFRYPIFMMINIVYFDNIIWVQKSTIITHFTNINNDYWQSYSILSEIKRLGLEESLSNKINLIKEEYKKFSEIYQKSKVHNKIPLN